MPHAFVAVAVAVVALVAGTARAQQQAGTVRDVGDAGFALSEDGRSRLHVGVDAGLGFDTNPYTTPLASNEFAGDMLGRIRPSVDVNVPGSMLAFSGRGAFDYGFLPGVVNPETQAFLLYQALATANLEVNRGGMFTFAVGDSATWNTDPGIIVLGSLLSRISNQLRAGVGVTPGGGALQFRLAYSFTFTKYIDIQGAGGLIGEGVLDTMNHTVNLRADYRFLPKTSLFGALTGGWQTYPFTDTQPQAFPVGVGVGLQGQVSSKLAGLVSLGYSNPMVVSADGLETGTVVGITGQAEAHWSPGPTTTIAGGFQRSFDPVALYQFTGHNKFYARASHLLGQFQVAANASWGILEFGEEQPGDLGRLTDRPTGRLDQAIILGIRADYYVLPWLGLGVANTFDWRLTNANDVSTATQPVNLSFLRNETMFLASARY